EFGTRPALLTLIDTLISVSIQVHSARDVGQFTLFDNMTDLRQNIGPPPYVPPIPDRQLLEWEKELLGTYLSKHPLTDIEQKLRAQDIITMTIGEIATAGVGQQLTVVGMVQRVRTITTKKGDMMAFVTLEGSAGTLDTVVFPKTYARFRDKLIAERILVASGKLDSRPNREDHPLLADWFKDTHELPASLTSKPGNGGNGEGYIQSPEQIFEPAPDDWPAPAPSPGKPKHEAQSPVATQSSKPETGFASAAAPIVPPERVYPLPDEKTSEGRMPAREDNGDNGNSRNAGGATLYSAAPPTNSETPATLYITFKRTGNETADWARLAQLHQVLKMEQGTDEFVVLLEDTGNKRIQLSFPNERTHYTPVLRSQVESIVGSDNLRIIPINDPSW
ncbi:MAG: hypothetical protein P1S60_00250, partial [Anaerolineae bacterium]|nr:hypothetical protein [Anaerolineae bacterium]